ncbi:Mor transcription activator family protein [Lactiplantibacillus carotarum]|uniref:Mor transcription activator family protein n=1 Tax=Lactiplantibacillus carotarum TaxID=2993456 RepID=UPI00298EFB07|nr:Mor transcription activator family protein [Lactiplantibacillus carotarum]
MDENVDVQALHQFYRSLSEIIGTDAMLKIYEQYKGTQLSIPVHLYDRNLAGERVVARFDGNNQQALSIQYGYSQKWVYKVLKAARDHKEND